jgi:hypothetical protein
MPKGDSNNAKTTGPKSLCTVPRERCCGCEAGSTDRIHVGYATRREPPPRAQVARQSRGGIRYEHAVDRARLGQILQMERENGKKCVDPYAT